jgi:hypothetical protein
MSAGYISSVAGEIDQHAARMPRKFAAPGCLRRPLRSTSGHGGDLPDDQKIIGRIIFHSLARSRSATVMRRIAWTVSAAVRGRFSSESAATIADRRGSLGPMLLKKGS